MLPLEGITVMDITTMINGPYCAMMLAEMGAEVIKIEPPDGDPWRVMGAGFIGVNRGKRSVAIDFKTEAGRQIGYRLAARADVVVENARWGVWHRLGMDYGAVKRINPEIIYVSIVGYGTTGPLSALPGYDPLLQARSGQMVAQGGIDKPPVFHLLPINDMAGPMLGAFGAALGLLARKRTGNGQNVHTSLANAAAAMQAHQFLDYGNVTYQDLGDSHLLGLHALHRNYQAKEGRWMFILCPTAGHWQQLCTEMDLPHLIDDPRFQNAQDRRENDPLLSEILEKAFADRTVAEWMAKLPQVDLPVTSCITYADRLVDDHAIENRLLSEREHPELGTVRQVGIIPRFSEIEGIIRRHAPVFGEHTEEALLELGYSPSDIADYVDKNVVFLSSDPEEDD